MFGGGFFQSSTTSGCLKGARCFSHMFCFVSCCFESVSIVYTRLIFLFWILIGDPSALFSNGFLNVKIAIRLAMLYGSKCWANKKRQIHKMMQMRREC